MDSNREYIFIKKHEQLNKVAIFLYIMSPTAGLFLFMAMFRFLEAFA